MIFLSLKAGPYQIRNVYIYIYKMLSSIDITTLGRMYPPISTCVDVSLATNGETV